MENSLEDTERSAENTRDVLKRDKCSLDEEKNKRVKRQEELQAKQEQVDSIQQQLNQALEQGTCLSRINWIMLSSEAYLLLLLSLFLFLVDRLLEKQVEASRRRVCDMTDQLKKQAWQLSQARLHLDQGHRRRDYTQANKLLQVRYIFRFSLSQFWPFTLPTPHPPTTLQKRSFGNSSNTTTKSNCPPQSRLTISKRAPFSQRFTTF